MDGIAKRAREGSLLWFEMLFFARSLRGAQRSEATKQSDFISACPDIGELETMSVRVVY
jgi:hypothetical protein